MSEADPCMGLVLLESTSATMEDINKTVFATESKNMGEFTERKQPTWMLHSVWYLLVTIYVTRKEKIWGEMKDSLKFSTK